MAFVDETNPSEARVKGLPQNAEATKNPKEVFLLPDTIMEPKLDGIRILAHILDAKVETYTRTGKSQTGKLPDIETELLRIFPSGTWLDGEVVGFNDDGSQDWGAAQSCLGSGVEKAARGSKKMVYVMFDMLAYDGMDIRGLTLRERHNSLETASSMTGRLPTSPVGVVEQASNTEENHQKFVECGYEGSVVKRLDAKYASGMRGHGWTKIKATDEADVVIMGFTPGENGFAGMVGAIEFGQWQHKRGLMPRGKCSGMDIPLRKHMTEHQEEYKGCVISITYMGIMPSGAFRHPQYSRLRDDKPAEDCEWTEA